MDLIERQRAIDEMTNLLWHYPTECYRNLGSYEFAKSLAELGLKSVPSAQPEPLLDEIVDEIRKTIAETESNGKYHADSVRHNGEMICHGLQIALNIIEEKRNERSD